MSWFLTSRMLRTWRPSWRRLVTRGLVGMRKAGRRTTFSTVSNANCPFELQLRTGAPLRGALSAIHRGQRPRERDGQKARDTTESPHGAVYRSCSYTGELYGRTYRFIVVHSSSKDKRSLKALEKRIDEERTALEAAVAQLGRVGPRSLDSYSLIG